MVYSPTVPARNTPPGQIAPEPWVAFNKAGCSVGAFSTANMVLENNGDIPTVFGGPAGPGALRRTRPARSSARPSTAAWATPPARTPRGHVTDNPPAGQQARLRHVQGAVRPQVPGAVPRRRTPTRPRRTAWPTTRGQPRRPRQPRDRRLPGQRRLPGLQPDGPAEPGGDRGDAGGRGPRDVRLHLRHPRAQGLELQLHHRRRHRLRQRPRPRRRVLRRERPALRPGLRQVPRPSREGRHHAAGTRCSSSARRRTTTSPARTSAARTTRRPGGLRRRHRPLPVRAQPDRRGAGQPAGAAAGASAATRRRSRWSRRAPRSTSRHQARGGLPGRRRPCRSAARARHGGGHGEQPAQRGQGEKVVNYQAGATEQRILHLETADPQRNPTYTIFPKPDYYLDPTGTSCGSSANPAADCVTVTPASPGTTATTARTSTSPGRRSSAPASSAGVDGPQPAEQPGGQGPERRRAGSAVQQGRHVGRRDRRPADAAAPRRPRRRLRDGRPRDHARSSASRATCSGSRTSASCYKQVNASVGNFGTDTLVASTTALASGSGDRRLRIQGDRGASSPPSPIGATRSRRR